MICRSQNKLFRFHNPVSFCYFYRTCHYCSRVLGQFNCPIQNSMIPWILHSFVLGIVMLFLDCIYFVNDKNHLFNEFCQKVNIWPMQNSTFPWFLSSTVLGIVFMFCVCIHCVNDKNHQFHEFCHPFIISGTTKSIDKIAHFVCFHL